MAKWTVKILPILFFGLRFNLKYIILIFLSLADKEFPGHLLPTIKQPGQIISIIDDASRNKTNVSVALGDLQAYVYSCLEEPNDCGKIKTFYSSFLFTFYLISLLLTISCEYIYFISSLHGRWNLKVQRNQKSITAGYHRQSLLWQ